MEFNKVTVDMDGDVATLRLNDPAALNAVSPDMLEGLAEALEISDRDRRDQSSSSPPPR